MSAEENLELPQPEEIVGILSAPMPEGLFPVGDCDEFEFRELLATIATFAVPRDQWSELLAIDDPATIEALVTTLREAGEHLRRESPEGYGMLRGNLALAYQELGKQQPHPCLDLALQHYRELLEIFTRDGFPEHWATTQNNLGIAYSDLPLGDRGENLQQAIACYKAALEVWTRDRAPLDWAGTQNNLGTAYRNLPLGDRGGKPAAGHRVLPSGPGSLDARPRAAGVGNHPEQPGHCVPQSSAG